MKTYLTTAVLIGHASTVFAQDIVLPAPQRTGGKPVFDAIHDAMKNSRFPAVRYYVVSCMVFFAVMSSFAVEPQPKEPYFFNDYEGGKKLDALMKSADRESRSTDEILETVCNGLLTCQSNKMPILRWISHKYIWGKNPQNEKAIYLMVEASRLPDREIYHAATYFGLARTLKKTPEIRQAMIDVAMKTEDYRNTTWIIQWACQAPDEKAELLKLLEPHLQSDDKQVRTKAESVRAFLNDPQGWLAEDLERKRQKAKEEYAPQFPELKQRLIGGNSVSRSELFQEFYRNNVTLILDDSFKEAFEACAKDSDMRVRRELARLVGGSMIWSAKEQSSMAMALLREMLKDTDRDVRYNAVYHGLSTVRERSDEQVAELLTLILDDQESNLFGRVVWGLRDDKDKVRKILDQWKSNEKDTDRLQKIKEVYNTFFQNDAEK